MKTGPEKAIREPTPLLINLQIYSDTTKYEYCSLQMFSFCDIRLNLKKKNIYQFKILIKD